MNMDEYRKQAEALREKAMLLESEMKTYQAFSQCAVEGHVWEDMRIDPEDDGDGYHRMDATCSRCGITLLGSVKLEFGNDETFGSLAGKCQHEIPVDLSEETNEIDEEPPLPLKRKDSRNDGAYRVDVSQILGQSKEE